MLLLVISYVIFFYDIRMYCLCWSVTIYYIGIDVWSLIVIIFVRVFPSSGTFGEGTIDTHPLSETYCIFVSVQTDCINYCHHVSLHLPKDELCNMLIVNFSNRFSNSLHRFQRATKAPGWFPETWVRSATIASLPLYDCMWPQWSDQRLVSGEGNSCKYKQEQANEPMGVVLKRDNLSRYDTCPLSIHVQCIVNPVISREDRTITRAGIFLMAHILIDIVTVSSLQILCKVQRSYLWIIGNVWRWYFQQERQYMYNVTLRHVCTTIVVMEKQ